MKPALTILFLIAMLPTLTIAQDCIDYGEYMHWSCGVDTPGEAYGVAIASGYAYIADWESGLHVIDIANLDNPQLVGTVDTPGTANDVAVAGDYAFVADGVWGLKVIDIADPENPKVVGWTDTPGTAHGVAVSNNFAFIADDGTGLLVIDITNPENPQIAGMADTPGLALKVAVLGNYAYVADDCFDLQVISIADPENPQIVGSAATPGFALDIAVTGNYAYVACGVTSSRLQVIDVTNPEFPQLAGFTNTSGDVCSVAISGNSAYVTINGYGISGFFMQAIDVTDPENPQLLGTADTPGQAHDLVVEEGFAYVADGDFGLQGYDVTWQGNPQILGSLDFPGQAQDVALLGSYAYVSASNCPGGSLYSISISEPDNPELVGSVGTGYDSSNGVAVQGNYAFVTSNFAGLQVIDISDPTDMHIVGAVLTTWAQDVAVLGNYAYVVCRGGGGWSGGDLLIIDISDPEDPQQIVHVETQAAYGIAVCGDYAYVTVHEGWWTQDSLLVFYVAVAGSQDIQVVGSVEIPDPPSGIAISGRNAYVCTSSSLGNNLQIIDITNPENPQIVGSVNTPDDAQNVAVLGDYAYVAYGDDLSGMQVVDMSEPEYPQITGNLDLPGVARGVVVSGSYAYVADGSSGLQITWLQCDDANSVVIDIKPDSDTNSINCRSRTGTIPVAILTTNLFDATTVDHATVRFGPDEAAEVHQNPHGSIRHEEDVDDDGDIDLLFHFRFSETGIQCGDTEATLTGMTYEGLSFSGTDQIRTISGERNEVILALTPQISPNPFNPQTTISFSVDKSQQIRIAVYDLVGRQVAILTDQTYKPGPYSLKWEGTDKLGRAVSSGTYIVRMETDSRVEARKVMLVR